MKKLLVISIVLFVFAVAMPLAANAQGRSGKRYGKSNYGQRYKSRNKCWRGNRSRHCRGRRLGKVVRKVVRRTTRNYGRSNRRYNNGRYYNDRYYDDYVYYRGRRYRRSYYERNRHAIDIAIGAGAGAVVGGVLGGRKGAVIGAGVGAGSGALYTYVLNPKKKRRRYAGKRKRRY